MKDYTILVTSTGSFSDERGIGLVYLGDDGSQYAEIIYSDIFIWAKSALLYNNSIYIVGTVGDAQFEKADGFIARVDLNGSLIYFKRIGKAFNDEIDDVISDGRYLYVVGCTKSSGKDNTGFIAKFDFGGNMIWAKTFGSKISRIKITEAQNKLYVAYSSKDYMYLAMFNKSGEFSSAIKIAIPGKIYALSADDKIYIGGTLENVGLGNGFIIELDDKHGIVEAKSIDLGFRDAITSILLNGSNLILVGKWGDLKIRVFNTYMAPFDGKTVSWIGKFESGSINFPTDAKLYDGKIYIAGYTETPDVKFKVVDPSEIVREISVVADLNISSNFIFEMDTGMPSFIVEPIGVNVKEVSGNLRRPIKGDAMLIKFAESPAPSTTTTTQTTTNITTTTTSSPTSSTTTEITSTTTSESSTTTQSKETIVVTTTVYTSSATPTTTSEEKGGVCGVGFILGLSIIPLIIRRKR